MLNNVIVAYERSGLNDFLGAPFYTNDFEKWASFGRTLSYLDDLLSAGDALTFFSDASLDDFIGNLGQVSEDGTEVVNYFEPLDALFRRLAKRTGISTGQDDPLKQLEDIKKQLTPSDDGRLFQDLSHRAMSAGERGFYKKLVDDQYYTAGDIYAMLYEYKTQ